MDVHTFSENYWALKNLVEETMILEARAALRWERTINTMLNDPTNNYEFRRNPVPDLRLTILEQQHRVLADQLSRLEDELRDLENLGFILYVPGHAAIRDDARKRRLLEAFLRSHAREN